jgi:DNA-binding Lrp family transcriptional regulator
MSSVLARTTDQSVEVKTAARKQTTIVQPEVSTRRVDKFQHMNAIRDSRGVLDKDDKLILFTLATHAKQQGHDVRPGVALLAEETGISQATLKRRMPNLVRKGYLIQVTSGKGGNSKHASLYRLALPVDVRVEVNSSPSEPLAIEANSSSEKSNSSSEMFNSSPGELTTSRENIQKNIPTTSAGGSPSGKTGPSAQESGHSDTPWPDSSRPDFRAELESLQSGAKRRREENDRIHDEYAERFHGGSLGAARRYVNDQTDGRDASIYAFMRAALGRAA